MEYIYLYVLGYALIVLGRCAVESLVYVGFIIHNESTLARR